MSRYSLVSTRMAFYPKVLSEVRALPGVSAAACISSLPMGPGGGGIWPVTGTGNAENERDSNGTKTVGMRLVSSSYFETMAIPLRSGRDISESDTLEAPPVAVVSQSFAERYWPGRDPIGRRFHFAFENFPFAQQDKTVVGVVGDVRFRGLERLNEPQVYLPYKQLPDRTSVFYSPQEFVVRSSLDTAALSPSIRRIIQKADPELPISAIRPMRDIVDTQTAPRSMQLHLVFSFAGLSLFLAGIGIYGLLSFAVGQRSAEFGLRIALGAQPRNILSMVLREGIILAGLGGVAGLVLSYFAGWSMQAVLAGVSPLDPATVAAAAIVALVMTLSGSLLPAVRAMRTDPASVIRMD
jgi:predicted permease